MSDLDDIAARMAATLGGISGLNAVDVWPDAVSLPMVIVDGPTSGEYELAFGGNAAEYTFEVTIVVEVPARRGLETGQRALRPYLSALGPWSLKAALYRDATLGGYVDTLWVRTFRTVGQVEINDNPNHYAATLTVTVRTGQ